MARPKLCGSMGAGSEAGSTSLPKSDVVVFSRYEVDYLSNPGTRKALATKLKPEKGDSGGQAEILISSTRKGVKMIGQGLR